MQTDSFSLLPVGVEPETVAILSNMFADSNPLQRIFGSFSFLNPLSHPVVESHSLSTDLILLGLSSDDLSELTAVQTHFADAPIVVLLSPGQEQLAFHVMQAGAQDYLVMGQFDASLLVRVCYYTIQHQRTLWTGKQQTAELHQRERFLTLLNDITQTAVANLDSHSIFQTLADRMTELINADACHITLWDEAQRLTIPMAASGFMRETYTSLIHPVPGEQTITASVLDCGHALAIQNLPDSPHASKRMLSYFPADRSVLGLPLIANGQKLGAALIVFDQLHDFTPDEIARCEQAAAQIALAVAKAQLLTAEQKSRRTAEMIRAANMALTQTLDLPTVLHNFLDFLATLIPFDTANIMLLQDDDLIVMGSLYGHEKWTEPEAIQKLTFRMSTNLIFQQIGKTRRGILIADTHQYPGWESSEASRYVRNWIGIPLVAGGELLGFYSLNKAETKFFTEEHLQLAETLAPSTAVAIQNAQLFQETRHRAEELQHASNILQHLNANPEVTKAFPALNSSLQKLTGCDGATIFLLDNPISSINLVSISPTLPAVLGDLVASEQSGLVVQEVLNLAVQESAAAPNIASKKPHFSPDLTEELQFARERELYEKGYRSKINLPLWAGEQIIGSLNLLWKRPKGYNMAQLPLLTQIANAIALAMERSRLFNQSKQWAYQMTILNELGRKLTHLISWRELCEEVANTLYHAFNYISVSIHRIDIAKQEVILETLFGPQPDTLKRGEYRQKLGEGLIGAVAASGEMLIVNNTDTEPRFIPSLRMLVLSEAVFPLKAGNQTIGILNVDSDKREAFKENDVNLLTLVADQLAIALEKVRLFNEMSRRTAELEAISHLSQALRETHSLEEMLPVTLEKSLQVVGGVLGSLFLIEPETGDAVAYCGYPPDPGLLGRRFKPGQGITGYVAATGTVYISEDLTKDPIAHFLPPETGLLSLIRSTISLPLWSGEKIVGVININLPGTHIFSEDETRLLKAMSEIAGNAIERATTLETLERHVAIRTHELETANIRLTELDHLKTQFVSDMSHELRTPITNLNLYLDLLERGKPEKQAQYISVLRSQTNRLISLIGDILSLSRLELSKSKVQLEPVNFNLVVEQVVAAFLLKVEAAGLKIAKELQNPLPTVYGERNHLSQLVTNLLSNAINYTPAGQITVCTCWDVYRDQICFMVMDTGIGITEKDKSHLFERFYRGEFASQSTIPGTGLGLAIVKEIVDVHHGEIEVESEVGVGSTFRVWLPLVGRS